METNHADKWTSCIDFLRCSQSIPIKYTEEKLKDFQFIEIRSDSVKVDNFIA